MPDYQNAHLPIALLIALLIGGCDAGFTVSRHDLGPFRIAAIGAVDGVARAMVWSGDGLYHDDAPALSWTLDGEPLGEGYGVAVPDVGGELGLIAISPGGETREAFVTVAPLDERAAPERPGVIRYAVSLGADLSLEARQAADAELVYAEVEEGYAARLSLVDATIQPLSEALTTRWMSAGGEGTLLEVEPHAADVFAEEITWDGEAIEQRLPLGAGAYHQLALVMDGAGGNRWLWVDAHFGPNQPFLHHEGRLIPGEVTNATGLVAATVVESDDLAGIELIDLSPVTDLSAQEPLLACTPPDAPFRLAWLAEGRCLRPDVVGARIVLEAW